jgi:hypothetical protein
MIDIPPARPARKLPVETVVKRAFLFSWESRHVLLQPFLIYAVLTILAELVTTHVAGPTSKPMVLVAVAEQIFAMAFAVGIHRFVLLGEMPAGLRFFHLDRYFVRYVLVAIVLSLLLTLGSLPLLASISETKDGGPATVDGATLFFGTITLMLASIILVRLTLLLPSAAAGEETRAKTIWETTQGNGFRLLAATLITVLPFLIAEAALLRVLPKGDGGIAELVVTVAVGFLQPAQVIVLTVMLALCYDLLVRGNGPVVADRRNGQPEAP